MPLTLTRSLLVILIPGSAATAPWLLWLVWGSVNVTELYKTYTQLVWFAAFGVASIIGSVLESWNSYKEVEWDTEREKQWDVSRHWFDYLARVSDNEPVGYKYIAHMRTTLYFELAMMRAISISAIGFALLLWWLSLDNWWISMILLFAGTWAHEFFRKSAHDSHKVLCETRKEMNLRLPAITRRDL